MKEPYSIENIYRCYRRCRRNKRRTINALKFEQNLEQNILDLRRELTEGSYQPRPPLVFMISKPKQREIFAADFRDRVVHHILVSAIETVWEKRFIHDSYACRPGKGNLAAVKRLQTFTRRATANQSRPAWYLQLDIKSYFVAIDRNILYQRLCSVTGDSRLQALTRVIIFQNLTKDCRIKSARLADFMALPAHKTLFKAPSDKGLPIGNLTSQFFGNVYLDALDQFVKHRLKAPWYVRYCDDFVLLAANQRQLESWHRAIKTFLKDFLGLELNDRVRLRPVANGIDFLGYIVRPDYLLSRRRVKGTLYERLLETEKMLKAAGLKLPAPVSWYPWPWPALYPLYNLTASYMGHFSHAASHNLIQSIRRDFAWLDEYFTFDDSKLGYRYAPLPNCNNFGRQIDIIRHRLAGHVLLIQLGDYWRIIDEQGVAAARIHKSRTKSFCGQLVGEGRAVAIIAETGGRATRVTNRQLIARLPAKKPCHMQLSLLDLFHNFIY